MRAPKNNAGESGNDCAYCYQKGYPQPAACRSGARLSGISGCRRAGPRGPGGRRRTEGDHRGRAQRLRLRHRRCRVHSHPHGPEGCGVLRGGVALAGRTLPGGGPARSGGGVCGGDDGGEAAHRRTPVRWLGDGVGRAAGNAGRWARLHDRAPQFRAYAHGGEGPGDHGPPGAGILHGRPERRGRAHHLRGPHRARSAQARQGVLHLRFLEHGVGRDGGAQRSQGRLANDRIQAGQLRLQDRGMGGTQVDHLLDDGGRRGPGRDVQARAVHAGADPPAQRRRHALLRRARRRTRGSSSASPCRPTATRR